MRKKRAWRRWTDAEDALIREHYPEHGGRWTGWARLMPDRMPTYDDVIHRAQRIGVRCNHRFRYGKGKSRVHRTRAERPGRETGGAEAGADAH